MGGLGFPGDAQTIQDGKVWIWTVRVEMSKECEQLYMRGEGNNLLSPSSGVSCCYLLPRNPAFPGGHLLQTLLGQDLALPGFLVSPAGKFIFSSE